MQPLVVIQNSALERGDNLKDFLVEKNIEHRWIKAFDDSPLPKGNEASAVIILGCPYSVNELHEFGYARRVLGFAAEVVREDIPFLGICYGAQLLAKVLGAAVSAHTHKEVGGYSAQLTLEGTSDPLFAGFSPEFPVFQWHGDTFKIPFGATLLAEAEGCRNQAFRKRNAVGVQFHLDTGLIEAGDWCDNTPQDVSDVSKTKEQVLSEYKVNQAVYRSQNALLIGNFLKSV